MNKEIWESVLRPKVAGIFDLDGVLVPQRQVRIFQDLSVLLRATCMLKFVASGRPLGSCWEVGSQISARGVFAENGAWYQMSDDKPKSAVLSNDIPRFREAIGLEMPSGVGSPYARIMLGGECSPILVESGKQEILTLGTVSMREQGIECHLPDCRWDSKELRDLTLDVIKRQGLNIGVYGPYEDHNIDYQPMDLKGVPYDKRIIPDIIREHFPWVEKIIAFVDGPNDVGLAGQPGVLPITFENGCDEVKKVVKENGGIVFDGLGYVDGCINAVQHVRTEIMSLGPFDLELAKKRRGW